MAVSGAIFLSIATIVTKKYLGNVPLGISNTVRTGLGTIVYFWFAISMFGIEHFMDVLSPFLWQVGINVRTTRLKSIGIDSLAEPLQGRIDMEQEIEGKIGFKGI
jgi:hypothetical protein